MIIDYSDKQGLPANIDKAIPIRSLSDHGNWEGV